MTAQADVYGWQNGRPVPWPRTPGLDSGDPRGGKRKKSKRKPSHNLGGGEPVPFIRIADPDGGYVLEYITPKGYRRRVTELSTQPISGISRVSRGLYASTVVVHTQCSRCGVEWRVRAHDYAVSESCAQCRIDRVKKGHGSRLRGAW